jgi:hypothetical protein
MHVSFAWNDVRRERNALLKLKVFDPGFPRDDPFPSAPANPTQFPTDVPVPEPHDVPPPQPMDDPPPNPGRMPDPPKPANRPTQNPKPRPVP